MSFISGVLNVYLVTDIMYFFLAVVCVNILFLFVDLCWLNHICGELPQVSVELAREPQASGDPGHAERHQVVQVAVRRRRQLERAETDVVQGLVVDAIRRVCVLDQLVC